MPHCCTRAPHRLCACAYPLFCLIIALLLSPAAVCAGSYSSPVYSGGAVVVTYASPFYQSNDDYAFDSNNGWGGYGSGVTFTDPLGNSTSLSETATGTITATFTWQPSYAGETAPASVIVAQHCTAGWVGHLSGTGVPTGSCDNGLGGSVTPDYEAGTCDSTKYTVQAANADGSVTVLCSPSVHLDSKSGTNGTAGGSVTVSYSATVYPITINLTGTTPDSSGNQNILVGQGCTATLNGIPSGTGWKTTYAWSVSGVTFQDWEPKTPQIGTTPANPNASYFVGGSGPLTNSTAHWYWNDPSNIIETVSCTATVTPPTGQGVAFSVNATQKVSVQLPTWSATGIGGYMQVNTKAPSDSNYELWGGPTLPMVTAGQLSGMSWKAFVFTCFHSYDTCVWNWQFGTCAACYSQ